MGNPKIPATPVALSVLQQSPAALGVGISWVPVTNATSYLIYRSDTEGPLGSAIATVKPTSALPNDGCWYPDMTTTIGVTYYYCVAAVNKWGTSAPTYQLPGSTIASP